MYNICIQNCKLPFEKIPKPFIELNSNKEANIKLSEHMRASSRSFLREMASFYKSILSLKILMTYLEIEVNLMETSSSGRLYIEEYKSSLILSD